MIDIAVYQDVGPISGGRGTPLLVTNFNMKDSGSYATTYFPGAPLVRPTVPGIQKLSYKVFTYFVLTGSYDSIKNLRFKITMTDAPQASDAQLFYKMTNTYETPTNNFDGDMLLLADASGEIQSPLIYPMLSTTGPQNAVSRQMYYNGTTPLYTNYIVTQMRVNEGTTVGNTAETELKFEAYEYGNF